MKRRNLNGETARGAFLVLPDEVVAETASCAGFDYVVIDCQHGLFGYGTMRRMIAATRLGDALPVVRVPPADAYAIGRALDAGAGGLIVPLINDAADVRAAVDAAQYGPGGSRSFGPMRALARGEAGYFDSYRDELVIWPQIETREALDNLAEIVRVPGIDGVYVGPMDLSVALGLPPALDRDEPEFATAMAAIVTACRAAGIAAGVHADAHLAARRIEQGFTVVTVATDIAVLRSGFTAALSA